jgi:hypothetical protein
MQTVPVDYPVASTRRVVVRSLSASAPAMTTTSRRALPRTTHSAALALLMMIAIAVLAPSLAEGASFHRTRVAFAPRSAWDWNFEIPRGGSTEIDDLDKVENEKDDDKDEEEDFLDGEAAENGKEEEVEEKEVKKEELDSVLAASAVKAANKSKAKTESQNTATSKKAINSKLEPKKSSKNSLMKKFHVPYIVRACLNPLTVFAMTKAFWASLFNLDYLKEVGWKRVDGMYSLESFSEPWTHITSFYHHDRILLKN